MKKFVLEFERPLLDMEHRLEILRGAPAAHNQEIIAEIDALELEIEQLRKQIYTHLTPWQRVQISRHPGRPSARQYIDHLVLDFQELHGERMGGGDDPAVVAGLGWLKGRRVAVIGQEKGSETKERLKCNFGMPHPEGYRKALRVAKLAERFQLPLLCLVDTPGAYPGIEAEERGQAWAIADNLALWCELKTPTIAVVLAEGGSGGALAIGITDRLLMLENSYYSVISPEGCAGILFHDAKEASRAASVLKLTATDLFGQGIADIVIPEPLGGAHRNPEALMDAVGLRLEEQLDELQSMSIIEVLEARYQRFRRYGNLDNEKYGITFNEEAINPSKP